MSDELLDDDYAALASFRFELRRFLAFSERAASSAGLTAQQHQALLALRAAPGKGLRVGELAERLLLRSHSASGLIDRLERLGLVRRSTGSGDGREVRVELTPEGETNLSTLTAAHRAELRRLRPLLADLLSRV